MLLSRIVCTMPEKLSPRSRAIHTMVRTMDTIIITVLSVSVHSTDFIPPLKVYASTISMVTTMLSTKGSPSGPNTIS